MEFVTETDLDGRFDILANDQSFQDWLHQKDADETNDSRDDFLHKLGFIFEFLATSNQPRGMAMRAWALIYAVRPDLVHDETAQVAADRFGVSQQRICEILKELTEKTGIKYVSKVGYTDANTRRKQVDAMSAARSAKALRLKERFYAMPGLHAN